MDGIAEGDFGAWVLVCDPNLVDITALCSDDASEIGSWPMPDNPRSQAMNPGDPVVLLLTGEQAEPAPGIWGVGRVTARPRRPRPGRSRTPAASPQLLVPVDLVVQRVLIAQSDLVRNPVLADSQLVRRGPDVDPAVLSAAQWAVLREALQGLARAVAGAGRRWNRPRIGLPMRRLLRTYAFDPTSSRLSGTHLVVDVPFETSLRPGPVGELVQVIDYDQSAGCWYQPVDLNDPAILAQNGLRPAEHDPRTHQQVVYAVAMSVLERFERFAGRRFRFRGADRLKLIPHAFEGRNAYYDPRSNAVLFGYYWATRGDEGTHLPGQRIFTCLSSDIVAHEVTHAIMHRWRPLFSLATNPDVFAWHEAFADLVALFQHFVHFDVVRAAVAASSTDLRNSRGLLQLAQEFGSSTGRGEALRNALEAERSPAAFRAASEPHQRGGFFVAAVFDAYIALYQRAIADLVRIATGGSGILPSGQLQADLVNRVTKEAVKVADTVLSVVVRAFDYLPVVDPTFGDVVRAIVTADHELYPDDGANLRGTLVEAMRTRGIYPAGVSSLADDALMWPVPNGRLTLAEAADPVELGPLVLAASLDLNPSGRAAWAMGEAVEPVNWARDAEAHDEDDSRFAALSRWAHRHAVELGLDPTQSIGPAGIHVAYRLAQDGQPRPEIVIQLRQRRTEYEDDSLPEKTRMQVLAGTTVIAGPDGEVVHLVRKPLPFTDEVLASLDANPDALVIHEEGERRLRALLDWATGLEEDDPLNPWTGRPMALSLDFAALHAESSTRKVEP